MTKGRAMVTGASGFVGAHLALGLARNGFEVSAVCGKNSCPPEVSRIASHVFNVDLATEMAVREIVLAANPDLIVHAAALAQAPICENNPELAKSSNILSTRNIIRVCQHHISDHPPVISFISSDLVFDGAEAPPEGFSEQDEPRPKSVYGHTKLAAERIVLEEATNSFVLRLSLLYGRRIGTHEGFMGWLRGGMEAGENVHLFADEWRTPVYAEDVITGVVVTAEMGLSRRATGKFEPGTIYHLSGPERISRFDFGLLVAEEFGFSPSLVLRSEQRLGDDRLGPRPHDVSLSVKRACTELGLEFHDPRSGLRALRSEM
jgi:dTDP-4-dehydrorhamnose reductase